MYREKRKAFSRYSVQCIKINKSISPIQCPFAARSHLHRLLACPFSLLLLLTDRADRTGLSPFVSSSSVTPSSLSVLALVLSSPLSHVGVPETSRGSCASHTLENYTLQIAGSAVTTIDKVIVLGTPHRLCQPVLKTCFLSRKVSSLGMVGDV